MMKDSIFKYIHLLKVFVFILFLSLTAQVNAKGNIPDRTADMLNTLSELQRIDVQFEDYEQLIQQIFSKKKYQKQVESQITEFLLSDDNYAGQRWFFNQLRNLHICQIMHLHKRYIKYFRLLYL